MFWLGLFANHQGCPTILYLNFYLYLHLHLPWLKAASLIVSSWPLMLKLPRQFVIQALVQVTLYRYELIHEPVRRQGRLDRLSGHQRL